MMEKSPDIRYKIDFLLSSDAQPTQNKAKIKKEKKQCGECNKIRTPSNKNNQICYTCYYAKKRIISSGNNIIDDFIRYTQINRPRKSGRMIFVPYNKFKNIELIGEGGFSKIYKATWIDSKITRGNLNHSIRNKSEIVALKKLNNSENITSKELNELKMFYHYTLNWKSLLIADGYVNIYYGITQDPITRDIVFIMPYYHSDLTHYITNDFFNIDWSTKIQKLDNIINGLAKIHDVNIIHRDLHSGNILIGGVAKICDLGISKSTTESATELTENEEEIYGIIPYVAPEVLQGKKYTKASDIYSFGIIMWEVMVGRKPFWDRNHNTELIIEICDGLRPPIVTNAPEGYIDLMKECWHPDPEKRPTSVEVSYKIRPLGPLDFEIIKSPDIGPITNNPDAIYKSRYLSSMIKSAASTRSLRSQSITSELDRFNFYVRNHNNKRKLENGDGFNNGISNKKNKLIEDENSEYATKELEFDIDINSIRSNEDEYINSEIDFDINTF